MFVGVALPADVRRALADVVVSLRARIARWVAPENLHVTIQFLGPVSDERVGKCSDAIGDAVRGLVDVPVHLAGIGTFPSARRARVVWAGLEDPAGGTAALADAIGERLLPLGFEREVRAFTPHITLARLDPPARVELAGIEVPRLRFIVDRATLYRSYPGRGGSRYEELATFPFRRAV